MKFTREQLSYMIKEDGYVIKNNGIDWIVQDGFIPFPMPTLEKSAQAHIDDILQCQDKHEVYDTEKQELINRIADLESAYSEMMFGGTK